MYIPAPFDNVFIEAASLDVGDVIETYSPKGQSVETVVEGLNKAFPDKHFSGNSHDRHFFLMRRR